MSTAYPHKTSDALTMVTPSIGRPPELKMTGTSSRAGLVNAYTLEAQSARTREVREVLENIIQL